MASGLFSLFQYIAKKKAKRTEMDKENPYLSDTRKPFEDTSKMKLSIYESVIKPLIDKILSFIGLIILAPIYCAIALAIYLDDSGSVFFVQKRIGKGRHFFELHKFRTMKEAAPHDMPTHALSNPDQYITRIGKILRKYSLDELPQIWDIFCGNMSIIGPRPALWNQEDLVAEREKYGANDVMPGLTGWAQINGRDELEISVKAKLDGEYVKHLKQGGVRALFFDVKCFLGTISTALKGDGVIEGGTGELHRKEIERSINQEERDEEKNAKKKILVVCQYYYPENFQITPICENLEADGYEITVLTGLPNYPTGIVPEEYRHGHRTEMVHGVHVIRCYEAGRKKGALSLAWNYATFTISALKKINTIKESFDLVLCYQLSPVFMGLPAWKYAKKHHIPFIIYCCDLWPESIKMYIQNESSLVFRMVKEISKKIYYAADKLVVQSASFIDYLSRIHGIDKEKMIYIPAFADETYLTSDFQACDEIVDFVFLGNLGIAQDLISVLKAVEGIKNVPGFKVHFVGDGACLDEMKKFVSSHGLKDKVCFYGRRPVEEMPAFYKLADACLVSLQADNATGLTLPSKVQGYMAAGKPVIAMMDGSARVVIDESGCGICVGAGDIKALSKAMEDFIEHPDTYKECGEKGRKYFKDNFAKEKCIRKLEEVIEEECRKNVVI